MAANTQEFQEALRGALSSSEARVPGLARFGRIWRRFLLGAVLDWEAPRQELADGLLALLRGLPVVALRPAAGARTLGGDAGGALAYVRYDASKHAGPVGRGDKWPAGRMQ
jgi:hypothetical protein